MKKILIVEDEPAQRTVLIDTLEKEGYEVISAKNGKEGLEIALREHPHLILLDIMMPIMDGMTMLKKLRAHEWGKTVPVIMLTNLSSDSDQIITDVTILEPSYYLVKSDLRLEDLLTKIKEILEPPVGIEPTT